MENNIIRPQISQCLSAKMSSNKNILCILMQSNKQVPGGRQFPLCLPRGAVKG